MPLTPCTKGFPRDLVMTPLRTYQCGRISKFAFSKQFAYSWQSDLGPVFSPTQRLFEPVVTLPSLVKERKAEAEKDGQQTEQTQTQIQESQDGYKPGKLTSAASASQSAQMG